jgi:hypothetical protein
MESKKFVKCIFWIPDQVRDDVKRVRDDVKRARDDPKRVLDDAKRAWVAQRESGVMHAAFFET